MSRYHLRRRAEEDITEILTYIAAHNPPAALKIYERLLSLFNLIAQFPEIGCPRNDLIQGMRSIPVGNYVVFFKKKEFVEIVRILHGARDIQENLF